MRKAWKVALDLTRWQKTGASMKILNLSLKRPNAPTNPPALSKKPSDTKKNSPPAGTVVVVTPVSRSNDEITDTVCNS